MKTSHFLSLLSRPIAHRGLWNENIPENSIPAYQNAVEKNFPIEIDVFASTDNVLFSFHDDDLLRLTGEQGKIYEKSSAELSRLRLLKTDLKIPTLKEVLEITENKIPVLIEIKNQPNKKTVDLLLDMLKDYKGEYAIQSFNPLYLLKVRKKAPDIPLGVLTSKKPDTDKFFQKFIVSKMPFNFLIKPDFISYDACFMPPKHKVVIAWTVNSKEQELSLKNQCSNFIFENYIP